MYREDVRLGGEDPLDLEAVDGALLEDDFFFSSALGDAGAMLCGVGGVDPGVITEDNVFDEFCMKSASDSDAEVVSPEVDESLSSSTSWTVVRVKRVLYDDDEVDEMADAERSTLGLG